MVKHRSIVLGGGSFAKLADINLTLLVLVVNSEAEFSFDVRLIGRHNQCQCCVLFGLQLSIKVNPCALPVATLILIVLHLSCLGINLTAIQVKQLETNAKVLLVLVLDVHAQLHVDLDLFGT